jgi:hypothetical protein
MSRFPEMVEIDRPVDYQSLPPGIRLRSERFLCVVQLNFAHPACLFRPDGSADWIPPTGFSDEMCSIAQTLFETSAMLGRLVKGVS